MICGVTIESRGAAPDSSHGREPVGRYSNNESEPRQGRLRELIASIAPDGAQFEGDNRHEDYDPLAHPARPAITLKLPAPVSYNPVCLLASGGGQGEFGSIYEMVPTQATGGIGSEETGSLRGPPRRLKPAAQADLASGDRHRGWSLQCKYPQTPDR